MGRVLNRGMLTSEEFIFADVQYVDEKKHSNWGVHDVPESLYLSGNIVDERTAII